MKKFKVQYDYIPETGPPAYGLYEKHHTREDAIHALEQYKQHPDYENVDLFEEDFEAPWKKEKL